jgi:uncharacterized damage-inducible protein DinB
MTDAVMYARHNRDSNKQVYEMLSAMTREEREKDRGSHFGGLSAMLRHGLATTQYFFGLYAPALAGNAAAQKALSAEAGFPEEGELDDAQWKDLGAAMEAIDGAWIGMAEALSADDLNLPVKLDWYGGNPEAVPLYFMLGQLVAHNIHHRGQISQVLDEMKIQNDFSGIQFLP